MEGTADMEQTIINAILAGFGAAASFILKVIWEGHRELQEQDSRMNAEIQAVKLMMANSYIKKEDFDKAVAALFDQLRRIEDKLDNKEDKA